MKGSAIVAAVAVLAAAFTLHAGEEEDVSAILRYADEAAGMAANYGPEAVNYTLSGEEKRFLGAFSQNYPKGSEPVLYLKLSAAAREHSEWLATLPSLPPRLDSWRLRPILWKHGVPEFQFIPVSVAVRDPQADASKIADFAAAALKGGFSACGAGMAKRMGGSSSVATVICVRRQTPILPFPRKLANRSSVVLRGTLSSGYSKPVVYISGPSGLVSKQTPAIDSRGWASTMRFDGGPGKYLVEVMATGPTGPEVTVLAPVYIEMYNAEILADLLAPLKEKDQSGELDQAAAEELLFDSIKKVRTKLRLPPIERDGRLDTLARAKSTFMEKNRKFGHDLPKVSLDETLRRAGVAYSAAGENLGVNSSPALAHYMFLNSPAHRANILNQNMVSCGIGVFKGAGGDFYVTEIFTAK